MNDILVADYKIRQLHARFSDAVWRQDAEAFGNCFTADGEWKLAGMHFRGREEISQSFARLLGVCERVHLIVGLPLLDISGDKASGRVSFTEFAKMPDGSSAMTIGIYYDRYAAEGDRWCFSWRHFSLQYRGPSDLSAAMVDSPDYGPPPGMPAPDEPTQTRRTQPL